MVPRGEEKFRQKRARGATFFTSRRSFDGLTVAVERFPSRPDRPAVVDGPAFVLVHGIGVSSRYFHPVAAELAKRGTVYLVDLPGYGAAPNPRRDVSISDHAAVLARVLEDSGLVNPVLVGHSMGSQVVSRLAVDSPEITDRIVLMAPTMPSNERNLWSGGWRLALDSTRSRPDGNLIVAWDYLVRCGVPYFLKQSKHLFGDHIEDRLAEIQARTLVLNGSGDLVVPVGWSRRLAAGIPNSSFVVVHGTHLVMFSDPVGVAEAIAQHGRR